MANLGSENSIGLPDGSAGTLGRWSKEAFHFLDSIWLKCPGQAWATNQAHGAGNATGAAHAACIRTCTRSHIPALAPLHLLRCTCSPGSPPHLLRSKESGAGLEHGHQQAHHAARLAEGWALCGKGDPAHSWVRTAQALEVPCAHTPGVPARQDEQAAPRACRHIPGGTGSHVWQAAQQTSKCLPEV